MTEARFRRRQHVMVRKVDAFFLAFVAFMAAADPVLFLSQLAASPAASTTAGTQVESSGDIPSSRQPVAKPTAAGLNALLRNVIDLLATSDAAGLNAAVDVEIARRFNELIEDLGVAATTGTYDSAVTVPVYRPSRLVSFPSNGAYSKTFNRSELLDHQAKTVDWWLSATATDYDEAIRLKPDYARAYHNQGRTNFLPNGMDEAQRDFETTVSLARKTGEEALASNAERALKKLLDGQDP